MKMRPLWLGMLSFSTGITCRDECKNKLLPAFSVSSPEPRSAAAEILFDFLQNAHSGENVTSFLRSPTFGVEREKDVSQSKFGDVFSLLFTAGYPVTKTPSNSEGARRIKVI